ncbi:sugar transporter SWEET1-like [Acanthaster planci]|uniref:Sugar transporter SWEET1 n=1 Tax=Acanthaster planci TaxID=133434 RepID=A0A8B7ZQZ9_ACAPL|nr:sugar transporter SWEET1-like [Acanthaster planci]
MEWMQILSLTTTLFTIGMFMAGIPDCLIVLKTGSTENVMFLPFLMTNLNNILWTSYGYLKSDPTIITVNAVGSFLQTCYMIVFMVYSPTRVQAFQRTVLACVAMVSLYLYLSMYVGEINAIINQLGFVCSSVTVLMYISPLAEIVTVIQTKSTSSISLPLTISTLCASSLWVLYGTCVSDLYILVPNVPGVFSSLFRIFLLWKYKDAATKPLA